MSEVSWPLQTNRIRRDMKNHTFGMVRTKINELTGKPEPKAHQGWDLTATPLTACYAIADGEVAKIQRNHREFGNNVAIKFTNRGRTLYAFYAHLSIIEPSIQEGAQVSGSDIIGYTGNTGNAITMKGEDQHLHFEIRTILSPGRGLAGRIDPLEVYGIIPIGFSITESHGQKMMQSSSIGLKLVASDMKKWTTL